MIEDIVRYSKKLEQIKYCVNKFGSLSFIINRLNYRRGVLMIKTIEEDILTFGKNNPTVSIRKTAEIFNVSKSVVEKIYKQIREPKKLIELNEDYFKTIDDEEKAYWLGFLFADCSVRQRTEGKFDFELCLQEKDSEHLDKFKKAISYGGEIKTKIIKSKDKIYVAKRIVISRANFCKILIMNGCVENKTFKVKFPNINEDLYRHFIRGVFDGDGFIYIDKNNKITAGFTGLDTFLSEIYEKMKLNSPKRIYEDKRRNSSIKDMRFVGKNALELLEYLYKNSKIHLNRKYEKYLIGKQSNDCL